MRQIVSSRQVEMSWTCSTCGHRCLGRDMSCTGCGKPKLATERYEMPAATAPTVTDPELLRAAKAGPNWSCSYCGSDQRRLDGACDRCGAAPGLLTSPRKHGVTRRGPDAPITDDDLTKVDGRSLAILSAIVITLAVLFAWFNRTRHYEATVLGVQWEQSIAVDRYQIWTRETWRDEVPRNAIEIQSLGSRIHHWDDVLDGYDTEFYTEQVACGQDCTPVPERCSESCTANGNGFATCNTTCTGGGMSCSTRYCSEPRTRQVPRYRQEPRYADFSRFKIWDWAHHRTVVARGEAVDDLRWPDEEARLREDLGAGEDEREHRSGRYEVDLTYDEGEHVKFLVEPGVFPSFTPGSTHRLSIKRWTYTLDDRVVEVQK